jgi:hypothetical protein
VTHLKIIEILKILLSSMARNALGVSLSLFLGCMLGLVLGILLFRFWNAFVARKRWLAVQEKADPFIRVFIIFLWVLAIPIFSSLAGLVIGSTLAVNYVITNEHIVEQAGRLAFRTIVAVVAVNSSGGMTGDDARIAYGKRLMKGEETLSLDYIRSITPRNLAEASTARMENYLPAVENRMVHAGVLFITERSLSWMVNAASQDRADFLYKTCDSLVRLDQATDRDGRVTVEEIATIITRAHLEKRVMAIIFLFGAAKASIILGLMAVVMVIPLLLAALARGGVRLYMTRRTGQKAGGS